MKDIREEVFNALEEIAFNTNANKEDFEKALEWFMIHFFEENGEE